MRHQPTWLPPCVGPITCFIRRRRRLTSSSFKPLSFSTSASLPPGAASRCGASAELSSACGSLSVASGAGGCGSSPLARLAGCAQPSTRQSVALAAWRRHLGSMSIQHATARSASSLLAPCVARELPRPLPGDAELHATTDEVEFAKWPCAQASSQSSSTLQAARAADTIRARRGCHPRVSPQPTGPSYGASGSFPLFWLPWSPLVGHQRDRAVARRCTCCRAASRSRCRTHF